MRITSIGAVESIFAFATDLARNRVMEYQFTKNDVATLLSMTVEMLATPNDTAGRVQNVLATICRSLLAESGVIYAFPGSLDRASLSPERKYCWGKKRALLDVEHIILRRISHSAEYRGIGRPITSRADQFVERRSRNRSGPAMSRSEDAVREARTIVSVCRHDAEITGIAIYRPMASGEFSVRDVAMTQAILESPLSILSSFVAPSAARSRALSGREQQVLDLLRSGCTEKNAATRLGVSRHTVRCIVKRIAGPFQIVGRDEFLSPSVPVNSVQGSPVKTIRTDVFHLGP
jgi:DNA-binding CsgD family transcriptional regulator